MKKRVGTVIIILFIMSYIFVMLYEYKNKLSPVATISQAGMFITGFTIWIWMITEFFKRKTLKHKVMWGWALIVFNILAAIVYFIYTNFVLEKQSDD